VPESSRQPDATLPHALALARSVLEHPPVGLLTDFDGTLSPIVADPSAAGLAEGAADALAAFAPRVALVAILTGRAALDVRRLSGLDEVLVAGNHGAEWLEPGSSVPEASLDTDAVRATLTRAVRRVGEIPGVSFEEKGLAATIHYRRALDPAATRAAIVEALGDLARDGLELHEGRMHVELRPIGGPDKGGALRAVVDRYRLRGLLVLGDDVTDLDMFAAARQLREAGRVSAVIIAVGAGDADVPADVLAAADAVLAGPEEVVELLRALAVSR
jgi:trehalose 6-phosphate phosphatase